MNQTAPDFKKVSYVAEQGVATITLNDPTSLNALDSIMKAELLQALQYAEYDMDAKVIVLTGVGKGFSSGGDIREMAGSTQSRETVRHMAHNLTAGVGEDIAVPTATGDGPWEVRLWTVTDGDLVRHDVVVGTDGSVSDRPVVVEADLPVPQAR